ncbi:MAG: preprotein translocase subunit SecA [Actinomycetota bacterium]|nr:preprotein translocase subunit SecA [Actinomycetota bacterium]
MFEKIGNLLKFGEGKKLKAYELLVEQVAGFEDSLKKLDDQALAAKTIEFKQRHKQGQSLEELMAPAFAVVREAARRVLGMRHFDVQIMGGAVLFEGKIAEMKTGEGKTLVATLPVYLNAIANKCTHLVTVNDYLAKRDSQWMGKVYEFLGLEVGLLQHGMDTAEKKQQYDSDVVYGTNNEFGFDYLRDNMVVSKDRMVQKEHQYAIIDEVDSILIDEARTPLIISGIATGTTKIYQQFSRIVPMLEPDKDFEVDEKAKNAAITEEGVTRVEQLTGIDNLYDPANYLMVHALNQSLKARHLFKKDVDYIVKEGEVIIVDEFTGRLMPGRRYSEGLHQAIEAKERVAIKDENQTLATITIQNYFRMYDRLAGMTGTAITEAAEFRHIYNLETVVIPTNKPLKRDELPDLIYKSEEVKFANVVQDIAQRNQKGQPVLVGTISIEKSEKLSAMLNRMGIAHNVLNAKHHEKEAQIVADAGQKGAVTIATNMAGRGTDIVLGPEVAGLGGLHVLGTERHESRRIDNQLRGRSGRQGDPGSSQFYLSTEDELLRLFGSERIGAIMDRFSFPDDLPIQHPMINRAVENAQRQVESRNFEIRKHVLEYDDVMNKQREIIYGRRKKVLLEQDLRQTAVMLTSEAVDDLAAAHINKNDYPENWDLKGLGTVLAAEFGQDMLDNDLDLENLKAEQFTQDLKAKAVKAYEQREQELGPEIMRNLERLVMLDVIDNRWREHLLEMDYLKEGIGLRAIGQRDPLVEYKHEAFALFKDLISEIRQDTVKLLFNAKVVTKKQEPRPNPLENISTSGPSQAVPAKPKQVPHQDKVGRNDPCPCGSGKKYKKCCGR